jgi:hypothetical protein
MEEAIRWAEKLVIALYLLGTDNSHKVVKQVFVYPQPFDKYVGSWVLDLSTFCLKSKLCL